MQKKNFFHTLICFCAIWGVFLLALAAFMSWSNIIQLLFPDAFSILASLCLHRLFCVKGALAWYALPLWYFSYYLAPDMFDSFGPAFVFGFLAIVVLSPVSLHLWSDGITSSLCHNNNSPIFNRSYLAPIVCMDKFKLTTRLPVDIFDDKCHYSEGPCR